MKKSENHIYIKIKNNNNNNEMQKLNIYMTQAEASQHN